ncbi:hypothetical protein ACWKSP_33830 [Micromonosporaceae bacterium Da 78-11]
MVVLRLISVFPPTGFPDRSWGEHPDEDAFARSARGVSELYSEAVRRARVLARHSELRILAWHDGDRENVLVTVHPEITEGFEMAVASLPSGIAGLPAAARAGLALEVIHGAAMRLGRERGWDEAALLAARAHVLAAGLRYRWDAPARTSPDRRHLAQAQFVLYDDGYGRVVVQVRRRADGVVVATSVPALAFSTSAGFARSASTLRWRSPTVVELVPYAGLVLGLGLSDRQGLVTVDLDQPAAGGPVELPLDGHCLADHGEVPGVPEVVVQTLEDRGPRIEVVGGGPMNDVPDAYVTVLRRMLDRLATPPWQTWWSAGRDQVLEIWYDFAATATATGTTTRRRRGTLRTTIRRPVATLAATSDLAGLARADVDAMLAEVRRRTGLGPPPPLR